MHVAFAVDDKFTPRLEVALYSLLKNNPYSIKVYVLSFDISETNKSRILKLCNYFKDAEAIFVEVDIKRFKSYKTLAHFSHDIYIRYLLPELLDDIPKVLYLDADILVTKDIRGLYDISTDGVYMAGVRDFGISKGMFTGYLRKLKLKPETYLNSGVLLMNLEKMRVDDVVNKLMACTERLMDDLRHPDQDVINLVMGVKSIELESKWNYQDYDREYNTVDMNDVHIVHYTTGYKPWNTPNVSRGYNEDSHRLYEQYEYEYYQKIDGGAEKVSIIIPVYNTHINSIKECVDSVLKQTYDNIETIIVDDGSDKEVANYLDGIAAGDSRVSVIHKSNSGTNDSRRVGFINSSGEYITFVDSDDTIEVNMIHKMVRSIKNNKSDIAVCEYWNNIDVKLEASHWPDETHVIEGRGNISRCRYEGFKYLRHVGTVWAKLYSRSVVDSIDWGFSNYSITEDEFMNVQTFAYADRLSIVRDQLYYYRLQNETSKEMNYKSYNYYSDARIPLLQTSCDLYEKSLSFYSKKGIKYDSRSLFLNYIAILTRQANQLIDSTGCIDKENKAELYRQRDMYMDSVIYNPEYSEEEKITTVLAYNAPIYAPKLKGVYDEVGRLSHEIDNLRSRNDSLSSEIADFFSVRRSLRMTIGNIKRKIKNYL